MYSRISGKSTNKPSEKSSSSNAHQWKAKSIEIDGQGRIYSVAFLIDGKHIMSSSKEGKIRHWRVDDGREVGTPMDAGHVVGNIAVSRDGKWVVNGTESGWMIVWDAESHKKVSDFKGHSGRVRAVDISPDGTRIATGSNDRTACVWSLSTSERLLGPLGHEYTLAAVQFSPDGRLIATATWERESIRVYNSQDGRLLFDVPIRVNSPYNQSLAWASDSKRIFALSQYGNIKCLDVFTGTTLSQWPIHRTIHSGTYPARIALATNDTFIAASGDSLVSFWDTTTHEQIGTVVKHTANIMSVAISASHDLATGGDQTITLHSLCDILPSSYFDDQMPREQQVRRTMVEDADFEGTIRSVRAQEMSNSKIARLEETVQQLRNQLYDSQFAVTQKEDGLNETIKSLQAQEMNSDRKIASLEETVQRLRDQLSDSQRAAAEEKGSLNEIIEFLHSKTAHLENTVQQLYAQHTDYQRITDSAAQILRAHEQKHQCEALYSEGRIIDAAVSLLEITNIMNESVSANKLVMDWLADFTNQCISALERMGDEASSANKHDDALAAYSVALSLSPLNTNSLLTKWASTVLTHNPANEALSAAAKFNLPRFLVYRAICDVLEEDGHISEAIECFQKLQSELGQGTDNHDEQAQWKPGRFQRWHGDGIDSFHTAVNVPQKETTFMDETEWVANFKVRCLRTLEHRGDVAMDSASYQVAIVNYTTALTLDPISIDLLTKRSKARARIGSWEDSLEDADAAIKVNPSSPRGYERKHVALVDARRYDEAIDAYNDMLQKIEQSPDPDTRESRKRYASPSQTMEEIRERVKQVQQNTPLVLINTKTGRLYDKHQCLGEFEADPKFKELVSSMTTGLDVSRITQTIQEYFRYATFSHTWEGAELLFHDVLHESVHTLAESPTASKLAMFCTTVREAGLRWAWYDTCCINKTDSSVVHESLTSMFRWYHESFLTIVHLKGVRSDSELGALERSLWNTRAWTLQEFFASKVIRFYTEDWKPYLPQEGVYNHKDSPAIMREMAAANGVDEQVLLSLRPGSDNVRQKLCLAATRAATKEEDKAYSLFGIFDVYITVTYGEKQQYALGRLLQEVLTRSGDVTLLAWTGKASDYHSCLPADIYVYRMPASPHVPRPIEDGKMEILVAELRTSSQFTDSAVKLYDRVVALSSPRLVSRRLSVSCMMFPLKGPLVQSSDCGYIYRAVTSALGNVDIETTEDLSGLNNLVLVHPWLQCLLEPALPIQDLNVDDPAELLSDVMSPSSSYSISPSQPSQFDKLTKALRLFALLRQPFGALLLAPTSHNEYKRVASDHPIAVRLLKNVTPHYLSQKIQTLDIL